MSGPVLTSPLVSTQWLADYLGSDQLVIVDASVIPYKQPNGRAGFLSGHEQYLAAGHIPDAVFADLISRFSDPESELPFTHSSAEAFAAAAGELGIDNETTVIVYDAAVGQWAARLWWLFRAFGYDRVAVLDGGYAKWIAETRATDTGPVEPTPATFSAVEHPEFWASREDVESIVAGDTGGALVCGIPAGEFTGEEGPRARLGHIPGSISAPSGRLVDRDTNAFLPENQLRDILEHALDQDRVVTYCAAGIAASADALALTVLGARNVVIYDGSLNEWANDESLPLATVAG
jgi:thiosulfate/3-mercaptopyruvate sulfurtransferase